MRYYLVAVLLFFSFQSAHAESWINRRLPNFSLLDQYGKAFRVTQYPGKILVFLAGDRGGSDQNHRWGARLHERYRDRIAVVGIADTRSVPFFLRGIVKKSFRGERVRVLLDWKGEVFTALGLARGKANVMIIDKEHLVRRIYFGDAGDACERVFEQIDRMLAGQ